MKIESALSSHFKKKKNRNFIVQEPDQRGRVEGVGVGGGVKGPTMEDLLVCPKSISSVIKKEKDGTPVFEMLSARSNPPPSFFVLV